MNTTSKNLWDFLEETECPAPATRDLFQWSLNYDHQDRPFNLFMDIIGYSWEHYGTKMYTSSIFLGYVEADMLADTLKEWADRPQQVENWITELFSCEDN